ncbi:TfoX/Sxy family protein [Mesorhizobium sp. LHD-90]|uniref:TfoX/Sxy family protein n=1 Tax=Mesorhizobium sp. LHD-90 TaxID=3071414 RepID=UPI0027DEE18E|nr:TfoX/Sxy family protein [Mesorhizobium sp. LHD-90]MDQ6433094.1 TfoX/Sxy family protein [Mesorhizobium sp. LHD-90]
MTSELADRIRDIVGQDPNIGEIRMFGGICFTLNGNMLVGTMKDGTLLVRVGEAQEAGALARPGASLMNFTGREMKGYIIVAADALDDAALADWIALASSHVGPMPQKQKKPAKAKKK